MIHWYWLVVALILGLCFGLWIRSHEVADVRNAAGEIYDQYKKATCDLRVAENWNANISKDLDHCAREREKLEALVKTWREYDLRGTTATAIDTLKQFGVPDTTGGERHD